MHTHIFMYTYIHTYVRMYLRTYIHTYIHTHIHRHTYPTLLYMYTCIVLRFGMLALPRRQSVPAPAAPEDVPEPPAAAEPVEMPGAMASEPKAR